MVMVGKAMPPLSCRTAVLGGVLLCNIALLATTILLGGLSDATSLRTFIIAWSFFPVCLVAIMTPKRKVVMACLLWLLLLYPLSAVWH